MGLISLKEKTKCMQSVRPLTPNFNTWTWKINISCIGGPANDYITVPFLVLGIKPPSEESEVCIHNIPQIVADSIIVPLEIQKFGASDISELIFTGLEKFQPDWTFELVDTVKGQIWNLKHQHTAYISPIISENVRLVSVSEQQKLKQVESRLILKIKVGTFNQ